ncbi:MAG: hypothetical protein V7L26_17595 [Nostoc sp.]|uniref:hypothetical protein n=1 Tax=Nostoc sp. TaxID=1180 RepID=UPI002FF8686C
MTINVSARNARIYIGGKDFSSCFVSFQGSDSHLDQNGIITFTGSIVLGLSLGFDESLDDRKNPRFFRGQIITVEVQNSQGNLTLHPRGALRIISPKYDEQSQRLTIDVGDLTALLNFREATDVGVTQITLGQNSTSGQIILRLLNAAGITAIGGGLPTTLINYPINLTGSYLANVGKLLYANNLFGWIDKNEVFQVSSALIGAVSSSVTINIGKDEIWYKRLDAAEAPCEIIKAVGRGVIVSSIVFRDDTTENYGAATLVDKTALPTPIIIKKTSIKEDWIPGENLFQTTTTTLQPVGLVVPKTLLGNSTLTLSLITSEIRIDKIYYDQDPEGKIKNKVSTIYQLLAPAILEFAQANQSFTFNIFGLALPVDSSYSYSYDTKGRQSQLASTTKVLAGSLLSNTDEDWTKWIFPPNFATDSEYKVETWNETSKGIWEYEFYSYQPLVKITPDSVVVGTNSGTAGPTSNKLDMIYADGDHQTSNSGQLAPPAPERRPALFTMDDLDLVEQVTFAAPGGNPNLRPRQRSFSVDFLAGQFKSGLARGEVEISSSGDTEASNQLLALALREGRLLWGRYKGQQIAVALSDAWFDYHPLFSISAIESDGTQQAFLADGCSWVVGQTRVLVSCDAIWLGTWQTPTPSAGQPSVSYVVPPYDEIQALSFGDGIGIAFNGFPYAVTTTTETSGLGLGLNCGTWVGSLISPPTWGNLLWDSINWDSVASE